MKRLTVKELIDELTKEDPNAVVAIENNGYPQTVTQLNDEGWFAGEFYMKKEPRMQDEYLMEDEIPADQKSNYIKVLVLGAIISTDEVNEGRV